MSIRIDTANAADVEDLVRLLGLLFAQEAEFAPDPQIQSRGLRRIMAGENIGDVFVARSPERIAGLVVLLYTVSTALGAEVALLEDMVVEPALRGRGIGAMLVNHALAHARRRGCRRVTLLTDAANAGAHRFYARWGFACSDMVPFRLVLDL